MKSELDLQKVILSNRVIQQPSKSSPPPLKWHANQVDLVELVYSLHINGTLGDVKLKDTFSFFEKIFNTKVGNYSHLYGRIKRRDFEKCSFLRELHVNLNREIEEQDR